MSLIFPQFLDSNDSGTGAHHRQDREHLGSQAARCSDGAPFSNCPKGRLPGGLGHTVQLSFRVLPFRSVASSPSFKIKEQRFSRDAAQMQLFGGMSLPPGPLPVFWALTHVSQVGESFEPTCSVYLLPGGQWPPPVPARSCRAIMEQELRVMGLQPSPLPHPAPGGNLVGGSSNYLIK